MSDSPAIAASRAGGATFAGLLGVAAAVIYVGAVIVGGWLTPGYSHVAHSISELTTAGAPYRDILNLIFRDLQSPADRVRGRDSDGDW